MYDCLMEQIKSFGEETDRNNANVGNNFSAKMLRIASEANKVQNLLNMSKELREAHVNGDIYYHDLDSYNLTVNCLHVDLKKVLDRGFNTGYGYIRKPKDIRTASHLMCIIIQSVQNDQYGGVSITDFENDLACYVNDHDSDYDIRQAMQGIVYNLNTMACRAGSQVPFSSINVGLPRSNIASKILKIFLEEYNKGLGHGEPAIFPNIIFRVKDGVNAKQEDPYYKLYKLACEVSAKRMNPTYLNLDNTINKDMYERGYNPCTMGCRTRVQEDVNGEPFTGGRGNIAPCTINLPRIAIESNKDINVFFYLLNEKISLAKDALLHRYSVLKNRKVRDLPFIVGENIWRYTENLSLDDSIEPILKHGTYGIGFIGLAETLIYLIGKHHGESKEAQELGIKIVSEIRKMCDQFKKEYKLNFSCYATPAEGLSGHFITLDKEKYGVIPGVTDKDYYTNSYHVPVYYMTSITNKLSIEAPYHNLCNGGHISYIELDNYPQGEDIMNIVNFGRSKDIGYMGINFHIRYCTNCYEYLSGYENHCHECGCDKIQGVSRVTGYMSFDERFGKGKVAERADRSSDRVKGFYNNKYIQRGTTINK